MADARTEAEAGLEKSSTHAKLQWFPARLFLLSSAQAGPESQVPQRATTAAHLHSADSSQAEAAEAGLAGLRLLRRQDQAAGVHLTLTYHRLPLPMDASEEADITAHRFGMREVVGEQVCRHQREGLWEQEVQPEELMEFPDQDCRPVRGFRPVHQHRYAS